jgi:DHA1 family bicyclomycin/chloramphenicol resistance-like MFS transporter
MALNRTRLVTLDGLCACTVALAEPPIASQAARKEAAHHGWKVLAMLSTLMAFASISTDLYLPAMPEMARSLHS